MADFNNDGNVDVAASNLTYNCVGVFLGTATGTLTPTGQLSAANALGVSVLDLDGDGVTDVATTNCFGSSVTVFLAPAVASLFRQQLMRLIPILMAPLVWAILIWTVSWI